MRPHLLIAGVALAWFACSNPTQAGLPPEVTGCQVSADCVSAGVEFVCLAGACEIQACSCDDACPAGLGCYLGASPEGQCKVVSRTTPCASADAGLTDGGSPDAGGGATDAGSADAG